MTIKRENCPFCKSTGLVYSFHGYLVECCCEEKPELPIGEILKINKKPKKE